MGRTQLLLCRHPDFRCLHHSPDYRTDFRLGGHLFPFMATQLKPSYLAAVPRQPSCLLVAVLHLACKRCSRRHMVFRLDIQIHYCPDSRCCRLYLQVETKPEKQNLQYPCLIPSAVFFQTAFSISDITLRLSTIPIKCYTLHTI